MAYIDRELLLQDISETVVFSVRSFDSPELRGAKKVIDRIRNAPAVDVVEVKHGEWIRPTTINGKIFDLPHCPVCENIPCDEGKYCPNCGAKMDGERKDT